MPRDEFEISHQIAQAGPASAGPGGAAPIGRVNTVDGTVTAQHVDGTVETLAQGAPVYQRDLITTKAGAKVALVFADKTTFVLGESGQMRLDEMIYDPTHAGGKLALSMLKGAFAFVSGDIAGTESDAMTVRTPVGTIGIRGTAVTGNVDPDGASTFSAVPDPSGRSSTVSFTNGAGTQIVTENFSITVQTFFTAPSLPFASPGGLLSEIGALAAIAGSIAKVVNPSGGSTPSGPAAPAPTPGPQGGEGAANDTPVVHVTLAETDFSSAGITFGFTLTLIYTITQPLDQVVQVPIQLQISPPPPPTVNGPIGFIGTVGVDHFIGGPGADVFNFSFIHNSLQSGDFVDGRGGADVLTATFDKSFAIGPSLTITNVPTINLQLHGASSLDALGITTGSLAPGPSTIFVTGTGALTVTDLQVNFDGSAMTDPLSVTAIAGGLTIAGGQAANLLAGAGFGTGDVLSYAKAVAPIAVNFAAGTAAHGGFTDTISGFDGVVGSAFNDNINVSLGGGHHFTVEGGAGNNTMTGSFSDSDTLSYAHAPMGPMGVGVSVDFTAGTASNGYGGNDVFSGFVAAIGSAFNDTFITTDTTRSIDGGAGFDVVKISGTVNNLTLTNVEDVIGMNPSATSTNLVLAPGGGFLVDLSGSGGNDAITIADGSSGAIVLGSGGDDVIIQSGGVVAITAQGPGDTISVNTGGGSDLVTVNNGNNALTITGGGDDAILSTGNNDSISVGGGNATIAGLGTSDAISVGGGQHLIALASSGDMVAVSGGIDTVTITGGGFETIAVGAGAASETLSVADTTGSGDNITALGNGAYMLALTGSGDSLTAGNGNDTINVTGGFDTIIWGSGNDLVSVSGSDDFIQDGAPPVTFGANTITANGSHDTLIVSSGNNVIALSGNDDSISALNGNNQIAVSGASDSIQAGNGNNQIVLSGSDDVITAGTGANMVTVAGAHDNVSLGGPHSLVALVGTGGDDTVTMGAGTDFNTIVGGQGSNNVFSDGGSASTPGPHDLLDYSHAMPGAAVDFIAGAATVNGGTDAISGFAQLVGTAGNDTITTSDQINFVEGGGGDDTVHLGGITNAVTLSHIAQVDALNANSGANVTVTALDPNSVFDFSNATAATLTLNIAGTTAVAVGQDMPTVPGAFEIQTFGASGAPGVTDLVLENGSYNLTFDGTEVTSPITVDASQLGSGSSLVFNGTAETGNFVVRPGGGTENLMVAPGTSVLAYGQAAQPVVLDITNFVEPPGPCAQTFVSGFSAGAAAGTTFSGFGTLTALPGSELVITAGVDGSSLVLIDLNAGQLSANDSSCATAISGFTTLDYQSHNNVAISGSMTVGNTLIIEGGDDHIYDNGGLGDVISLTNGNDTVVVANSTGSTDTISAGTGDDVISLGADDAISVGNGHFAVNVSGFDTVSLGGGQYLLNLNGGDDVISATGSIVISDVTNGGGDTVTVGNGPAFLDVGGPNDAITVGNANDLVTGGFGNESIVAGNGNDLLSVSGNNNNIVAGNGNDFITSNADDSISLGSGADTVNITGFGHDLITVGGGGSLTIQGTAFDTITSAGVNETINLGTSDDNLTLTGAGDTVNLGNGNVTVTGFEGGNTLNVGSGTDTLVLSSQAYSFSNAASGPDANTDVINGFQDTGAHTSVVDLSNLSGAGTESFAGQKAGANFAAAFGGDAGNAVDYAVIGGNTFVHAAGPGGGYSAGDLLVELTGAHTLTGANFHLHP